MKLKVKLNMSTGAIITIASLVTTSMTIIKVMTMLVKNKSENKRIES